jgi:elongation factor Ts
VRRFGSLEAEEGVVYGYLHGRKIGVLVSVVNGTEHLGRDLAMQIAASNPISIDESQISRQKLEEERKIFTTQAKETGKPDSVVEKIVEGKMRKFVSENTLLGQQFVKDTQLTVGQVLESNSSTVESFIRYELGEGLEKRTDDFVGEVLAQAAGN